MIATCVYQAFSRQGVLLYVGLSKHWPNRWMTHAVNKEWWREIARLDIQWFPTKRTAEWMEGYLIRTAHPQYNQVIPDAFEAPSWLTTRCSTYRTGYAVSLRPPGSRCEDLSLKPIRASMTVAEVQALACAGTCLIDGKWECHNSLGSGIPCPPIVPSGLKY